MPYATLTDLEARLAPELRLLLADDDGDGVADAPILEAALDDATAAIDQALGRRYAVPLEDAPAIVRRWCIDLALAWLFNRRREAMTAEHAAAADLTRRALQAIGDGLAGLAGVTPRAEAFAADNTRLDPDTAPWSDDLDWF